MTKLELEQRLAAANKELEAQRLELSILRADVARLRPLAPTEGRSTPRYRVQTQYSGQRVIKRWIPV